MYTILTLMFQKLMLDCTKFSRVVSFVFSPKNIDVIGYEMTLNKCFQTYMYLLFHLGS